MKHHIYQSKRGKEEREVQVQLRTFGVSLTLWEWEKYWMRLSWMREGVLAVSVVSSCRTPFRQQSRRHPWRFQLAWNTCGGTSCVLQHSSKLLHSFWSNKRSSWTSCKFHWGSTVSREPQLLPAVNEVCKSVCFHEFPMDRNSRRQGKRKQKDHC